MRASGRLGLFMLLQIGALGAAIGCGGDEEKEETPGNETGNVKPDDDTPETLKVIFPNMYSAYIEGRTTQLPVVVDGKTGAEVDFTADKPELVDITRTTDGAMITMRGAGTTKIRAKAGTEVGSATLTIESFTPEEWEAGNMRYNMGRPLGLAEAGVGRRPMFDAGLPPGGFMLPMIPKDTACASCHGETSEVGDLLGTDIEHTPQQTGGYSTNELVNIFTMGKKPTGVGSKTGIPLQIWTSFHQWEVSEEQRRGVVAYLRSLTPKSQGAFDFGGLRARAGAGARGMDAGVGGGM